MNWGTITTIGEKVAILAIAALVIYVVLKVVVGALVDLFGAPREDDQKPGDHPAGEDPVEDVPGLHVLSEYGERHTLVDESPTEEAIRATIRRLEWVEGFHQVVLVTAPGVSLEVGGSLDPSVGLSSVHRDRRNRIHRVTEEPPTTVNDMEDLLVSFHRGDGRWERMYDYT